MTRYKFMLWLCKQSSEWTTRATKSRGWKQNVCFAIAHFFVHWAMNMMYDEMCRNLRKRFR